VNPIARGLLVLIAVLQAPLALATSGADAARWRLALGAGTDLPISVGGRLELETPSRFRLSTSLGFLPGAYVDAINETVVGLGGYDQETADLVKDALKSSLIWRTHLGYRVWRGLYLEAGYGLVTLGGSAVGGELFSAVTGETVPPGAGADRPFDLRSTLHMADVEVGWNFALSRLGLRVAIGGAFTFAASTHVSAGYTPLSPQLAEEFARAAEAYLDDVYTSYVFTPVLSVSASYALF